MARNEARRLSVVTVVRNEPQDLERTVASLRRHLDEIEYWVIDGSTDDRVRVQLAAWNDPRIKTVSEPDDGLYDAMNKGLARVRGDYVLFINAGDTLQPEFDPETLLGGPDRHGAVLLGYSIEAHRTDRYLRPARGRESQAFGAPAHQATVYPRAVYTRLSYDTAQSIKADAYFTGEALRLAGGFFVDVVVCQFELGGRSSSYGDRRLVRRRLEESTSSRETAAILAKATLWHILPRRLFYRLLAWRKYDRLGPSGPDGVNTGRVLSRTPTA